MNCGCLEQIEKHDPNAKTCLCADTGHSRQNEPSETGKRDFDSFDEDGRKAFNLKGFELNISCSKEHVNDGKENQGTPGSNTVSTDVVSWVSASSGRPLPPGAMKGGVDRQGVDIYVGRVFHEGHLIPCKVTVNQQTATMALAGYAGVEITKQSFEVLCISTYDYKRVSWRSCQGSTIPHDAIPGGHTASGETLYIGRVFHTGIQTIGKVLPSGGCCYYPFCGKEFTNQSFEILCLTKS